MPLGRIIESCTFKLRSWRPFGKTLGSDSAEPRAAAISAAMSGQCSKRICRADRATSIPFDSVLDISKLSLFDDDKPQSFNSAQGRRFARKRRRRLGGSRSVSGRSSDRKCRSVSVSAANGTCSDFLMAAGSTDSGGELFWDARWVCDVSKRRENEKNVSEERDSVIAGPGVFGNCDVQGNESGYGSEPGYKGDVELEYGDELDDDEEDVDRQAMFWGEECGEDTTQLTMEIENSLQKGHHRCRRKKHDLRMADALR